MQTGMFPQYRAVTCSVTRQFEWQVWQTRDVRSEGVPWGNRIKAHSYCSECMQLIRQENEFVLECARERGAALLWEWPLPLSAC